MASGRYRTASGTDLKLGAWLGGGGGGEVYSIVGNKRMLFKRLTNPKREDRERIEAMVAVGVPPRASDGGFVLAWPTEIVYAVNGRVPDFAGFTMPAARGPNPISLYTLSKPNSRERYVKNLGFGSILTIGANYASAIEFLHQHRVVVGDINETNAVVSGNLVVTVIDCDSMTIRHNGRVHLTPFHKAEFLAPELRGVDLTKVPRSPEHDQHAFAMLLWMTLMGGYNPFQGVWKGSGDGPRAVENAAVGRFAWEPGCRKLEPPLDAPPLEVIPAGLQKLFIRAFTLGARQSSQRPAPGEWAAELNAGAASLVTCSGPTPHHHPRGLKRCPWCAYTKQLTSSQHKTPPSPPPQVAPPPPGRVPPVAPQPPPPPRPPRKAPRYVRDPGVVGGLTVAIAVAFLVLVVILANAGVLSDQAFFDGNPLPVLPLAWPLAEGLHWLTQIARTSVTTTWFGLLAKAVARGCLLGGCAFLTALPAIYVASLRPGTLGGTGVFAEVLQAAMWTGLWTIATVTLTMLAAGLSVRQRSGVRSYPDPGWLLVLPIVAGLGAAMLMNPSGPEVLPLERWFIIAGIMGFGAALCVGATLIRTPGSYRIVGAAFTMAVGLASLLAGVTVASSQVASAEKEWAEHSQELAGVAPTECDPIPFALKSAYRTVLRAELRCRIEAANVRISWLDDQAALRSFTTSRDIELSENGECRNGRTGSGEWALNAQPDAKQGVYQCYFRNGRAHFDYTFDHAPVYVSIARRHVSVARLYKTFTQMKIDTGKL